MKRTKITCPQFDSYKDLSEADKTAVVESCRKLISKIVKQFHERVNYPWDQLESMALEGLALAMNKYDKDASSMSFFSYAGYAIRNNILNNLDKELRTVRMSSYAIQRARANGENLFTTSSLDNGIYPSGQASGSKHCNYLDFKYRFDAPDFADGNVYEYLYTRIDDAFSERDCMIFYKVFGLKSFEPHKNKDVAAELGVSECLITQKCKRIINYIKKDEELCEMLAKLGR